MFPVISFARAGVLGFGKKSQSKVRLQIDQARSVRSPPRLQLEESAATRPVV